MWKEIKRLTEFWRQVLQESEIIENKLFLKTQMDRKQYMELNKILELLWWKRNRKEKCHIFECDNLPEAIEEVCDTMEVVDIKVLYQQFYTPPELAKRLVELAEIEGWEHILEPSAWQGAILDQIDQEWKKIVAVEIDDSNCDILKNKWYDVRKWDFMKLEWLLFDKIIMNPPFTKSQDVKHILHAYSLLKDWWRIVSIASSSIQTREWKLYEEFNKLDPEFIEVEEGTFKESWTMVNSVIVVINK